MGGGGRAKYYNEREARNPYGRDPRQHISKFRTKIQI